ncbi:MAG: hypothetical protein R3277_06795 [Brumimicrobium sp.]|nr:hypothetical protein [Brumimicrobium sp.]
MPKTASPALFELISSMSKSEKRYFKLFASRHTIGDENNYVKIFDFIESQQSFNEEEIYEHFSGEAFLNKFSITKNRLYEQIMRSLDSYYSNSSIDTQVHRLIHGAQILYNKGLYDHAKRQLLSAEKLAEKNQRYLLLQQVNNQLRDIIETEGYRNHSEKDLEKIHHTDHLHREMQAYLGELWILKSTLFMYMNQKGKSRSEGDLRFFQNLFSRYQNLKKPQKVSYEITYLENHFESAYYFAIHDKQGSLDALERNLRLMKKHDQMIVSSPNKYLSLLTNIIHLESAAGNFRKVHDLLKELKFFTSNYNIPLNEDLEIKLFSSTFSTELMLFIHKAEFDKALSIEQEIIDGFKRFGEGITPLRKAYLAFNLAVANFGTNNFSRSLYWVNEILNDGDLDQKEDIIAFAKILNLIIHYELKNDQLLPYALKSTARFLKKRNRVYRFETVFLKHIRKISNADDRFEVEQVLKSIEQEIDEIASDPFESVAFEYFDFRSWLKSKIKNIPFSIAKREAYLSNAS